MAAGSAKKSKPIRGRPEAMAAASVKEAKPNRGRTGAMAAGLILGVVALFMVPMSLREFCTSINRRGFVLDDLQFESFTEGTRGSSSRFEGHLVSTGEGYVSDRTSIVGLDRLRELSREKRLVGYRTTVRYLPKQEGFWAAVDRVIQFRVQSPEDFDQGFPAGLVAAHIVIAGVSIWLIRRGAGFPRRASMKTGGRVHSK